jgi:hypothetical protein
MAAKNKIAHPEPSTLVGIRLPGVYKRRFIDYLTDAQLTRLAFWLSSHRQGQISAHRLNQIAQAVEWRGLQIPAVWQKLPFDDEVQRAAWELWAAKRDNSEANAAQKRATKKGER